MIILLSLLVLSAIPKVSTVITGVITVAINGHQMVVMSHNKACHKTSTEVDRVIKMYSPSVVGVIKISSPRVIRVIRRLQQVIR